MATASLGRLTLDLLVKLGSYEQGLNRAERQATQSANKMSDAFKGFGDQLRETLGGSQIGSIISDITTRLDGMKGSVLVATAGLAGMAVGGTALAVGGLSVMAIQAAKADANLAMLANRTNIGIKNFQVMTYAAEQLGISQEQLGSIFADVQEKLGEFSATGAGGAIDFFDALKNNTKLTDAQIKEFSRTLQGKDGIEAVQLLKDKLDELGASSQEQRFVFESLASDLGNLLPLFADGGELIKQYGDALEDAGLIKTKEAVKQSQLLAAQTQAVNLQFQGAKNQLVTGFTPALTSVADAMFGTSKNGVQLSSVGSGLGTVLKSLATITIGVSAVIQQVGNAFGAVAAMAVAAAKRDFKSVVAIYHDSQKTFDDINSDIVDRYARLWDPAATSSSKLTNALLAVNNASNQVSNGLKVNTKEADENAKAKDAQAKAAAKLAKEQDNLNKIIGASEIKSLGLRLKSSETISGGGVKAYTAQFAKMTQDLLGSDLTRFTALNDGYHQGKGGKHPIGQAFDFTVKDAAEANRSIQRIQEMAKKYGFVIKTLNEYSDPSKKATGGHIHVSVLGYKGTSETLKDAQALVSIASDTQEKIGREQQSIALQYADEQIKLKMRFESEKQRIEEAYINNPSLKTLYINKAQEVYDRDLNAYRKNEMRKREEAWRTLDEVNNALTQSRINSLALITMNQQQLANWNRSNAQASGYSQLGDSLYSGVNAINQNELLSEQEKQTQLLSIYEQYLQARNALSAQYAQEDIEVINQQHASTIASYANMFGSLGELVKGYAGETSSAYKAILAIQKGANLASVLMNSITAISAAWASAPFPYNIPAVAMATVETGALQATLQAFTPQGFATGGHILGAGTKTSDSIPIMASNGEFMMRAAAVDKVGVGALDYINRTGELPKGFADGGVVDTKVLDTSANSTLGNYLNDRQGGEGVNVNINVPPGYTAVESRDANGNVTIDVVEKMIKQSWSNLNQANSYESKQARNNIAAGRVR